MENNEQPRTRQQIYDAIAQAGTKEEFVLSEMKRLGFWDVTKEVPKESEALRLKRQELVKQLNDLLKVQQQYGDSQKLLKEMRAERMANALKKREETKARRIATRTEKARLWSESQAQDITYLGEEVSGGLNQKESDTAKLQQLGLPAYKNVLELAQAMGVSMSELRFLAFDRRTSRISHYQRFEIPKKTGGTRKISAPMPRLKKAQYWILQNILYPLQTHKAAHGFVPQLSIITNAQNHVGKDVLINIDLKNFFPTITYRRIKGMFVALGYSEQLATIFALLCSEPDVDKVELDGKTFFVARGQRLLPQGAPTSPALTNIICYKLDIRIAGMAAKLGFTYSRYADDISLSAMDSRYINLALRQAEQIITDEGFIINPNKVEIMRKGAQKEVTGIVVNEKLNVSKAHLKQFRAVLHTLANKGADKVVFGGANLELSILGFAQFVNMVNPEKGEKLLQEANQILARPDIRQQLDKLKGTRPAKFSRRPAKTEEKAAKTETKSEITNNNNQPSNTETDWWDIFA